MEFTHYQNESSKTRLRQDDKLPEIAYLCLGLSGETGELINKIKKIIRDENCNFNPERCAKLKDELGDVLWYLSQLAAELGIGLDEAAVANLEKVFARKFRGTLQGDGDNR